MIFSVTYLENNNKIPRRMLYHEKPHVDLLSGSKNRGLQSLQNGFLYTTWWSKY